MNTSLRVVGLAASECEAFDGPTLTSTAELVTPASTVMPAMLTFATSATSMAAVPLSGVSDA